MIGKETVQYFTENLDAVEAQYDSANPEPVIEFIKASQPRRRLRGQNAIDLGAGLGHFARFLKDDFDMTVTAVEPVDAMRQRGQEKFSSLDAEWVDAALPELNADLLNRKNHYMLALMLGSWHYLDNSERLQSLMNLAPMMKRDGHAVIIYPYPCSRPGQFAVSAEETVEAIRKSEKWEIADHKSLSYPVLKNKEAAMNKSMLLAFDIMPI